MKLILISLMISFNLYANDLYQFSLKQTDGTPKALSEYKGKTVVVTNIATRCGYTPQLDDLEKLYKKYQEKGLIVIGVPSNNFGGQTPESDKDVAKFCKLKYGVSFPVFAKAQVKGDSAIELFKFIEKKRGSAVGWNFNKILFNADGKFVKAYSSFIKPLESDLETDLKNILKK